MRFIVDTQSILESFSLKFPTDGLPILRLHQVLVPGLPILRLQQVLVSGLTVASARVAFAGSLMPPINGLVATVSMLKPTLDLHQMGSGSGSYRRVQKTKTTNDLMITTGRRPGHQPAADQ